MRFLLLILLALPLSANAAPRVVASVPPLHGLVSSVMEGSGAPTLLIPGSASPHHYALKPSDARALAEAEMVFLIGAGLEGGAEKAIATLGQEATVIRVADLPGLELIHLDEAHDHDHGHDHGHGAIDPHLWLDPQIAKAALGAIADALAAKDPANAELYRANANKAADRIDASAAAISVRLAPIQTRDYVVYHDAYRYFERRFGLEARAVLGATDATRPGPRGIAGVRDRLAELTDPCIFAEPQHDAGLVETLAREGGARIGWLDPMGASLEPGPGFYTALLEGLAEGFVACLSPNG